MSGQAIIAGTGNPIEGPTRLLFRRVGGKEVERTWTGQLDTMFALFNALTGYIEKEFLPNPGSPIASVRARFARVQDGQPDDEFEVAETVSVRFNTVPVPINQHSYFADILGEGNNEANMAAIAELDRLIEERSPLSSGDQAILGPDIGSTSKVFEYYWHRRMRIDSFQAKMPLLTYTRTVPEDYEGSLEVESAGKIFTTDQVSARTSTPTLFTVPTPDVFLENAFGFLGVGWMLDAQVDYLADGSVQLVENYEWGQYSLKTHEAAGSP